MAHCGVTLSLQLCLSNLLEDNCQQPGGRLCLLVSRRGEVNHFHDPPKTQVCSSKRLKNKSMIWDLLSVKGDTCYSVAQEDKTTCYQFLYGNSTLQSMSSFS